MDAISKHLQLTLCAAALLGAASALAQQPAPVPADAPYKQSNLPIELRVHDLVSRMTVQEKARQLDMYRGVSASTGRDADKAATELKAHGFQPAAAEAAFSSLGVGSIHDLYATGAQNNDIQTWVIKNTRLGIPVLFAEEGLHWFRGTIFPAPIGLAATWDPQLATATGAAIASETRATGVGMLFAPVLDLARDPRWGRIEEDYGEDPYFTGQMGLAMVRGFQGDSLSTDHTLIAEPKHFAGHGSPESGTNTSPVHIGERELRSIMLKSFEPAFREGHAMGTMAAYHEIDGIPVTDDPYLLTTILRNEWGFQGFVLSDLGAIRRLYADHHVAATPKDAVVEAINAGVDMQFYDFDHQTFQNAIIDGLKDGSLSPVALDRAVSSVLRVKFELGLFDHPLVDPTLYARVNRSPDHLAIALQSARESMTLLKNDNHLLPLSKDLKTIAVIGPNAKIARYGDYAPESDPNSGNDIFTALQKLLPGTHLLFADGANIDDAVAQTKSADAVILALGESHGVSGEGHDRSDINLPGNQEQLLESVIAAGKPSVLVLQNGRPLTIAWAKDHVPAILEAWYAGERSGQAIAETLFGDNNPGGHLTVTFPRSLGVIPDEYDYDPSKTHRYVDGNDVPVFPFGYGLSYTTFKFDTLHIDPAPDASHPLTVTAQVTNTGSVAGDEVAQLYMRQDVGSVETPARALKGFSRIHLNPGESKTVTFEVPLYNIALWNAEHNWVVEPGTFTVWVGDSSQATLTTSFKQTFPVHF
jgi:beta-glucosidase